MPPLDEEASICIAKYMYIASFEFTVHSGLCSFYHLQICSSEMLMAETPRAPNAILKLFSAPLYPFVCLLLF
uniref:Uncharacterized protein n=2 Tax=Vibrio harveyi group TaxID=717610 RepID=A0A0K0MG42_VIBPH|nr:hypothetical protein pVA1042 [Vibrio parahaemolyticus]AQT24306.1 hypothetical protein [Vibrio owensii]